ncbi:zinc-containing alcohol dehydrogenase/quinone oxidoreductase [Umbelopsis sp. PMI_123]|nr:zinc-containing alcohol dehydrogenase/quinone oxidoreductase [Umbelopsis sp. PMI_123]
MVQKIKAIEIDDPIPNPTDIKVRIKAVSVNPGILKKAVHLACISSYTKTRSGDWPLTPRLPWVLGFDASGVVEAVGSQAKRFNVGDEVMFAGSHDRNGTNSEFTTVDERIVGRKPKSLSHTHAAALPLVSLTAGKVILRWSCHSLIPHPKLSDPFTLIGLTEKLGITKNNEPKDLTLLIVNGAGGVGSFATQLARNVLNVKNVIVTASRNETIEWCQKQGATHIINHRKPLKEQIDALGLTVDCAFGYLPILTEIVRPFGQILSIVDVVGDIPFGGAMMKVLSFHWEAMFAKALNDYDMLSQGHILDKIADLVDNGTLKRIDWKTYDLSVANLREVHETVENGKSIGKMCSRSPTLLTSSIEMLYYFI